MVGVGRDDRCAERINKELIAARLRPFPAETTPVFRTGDQWAAGISCALVSRPRWPADDLLLQHARCEHFVSVTQQFNTTTSMGRLTLNVLLSFAQFEREVTSERIRDKIAASKRKGLWVGGMAPLGLRHPGPQDHRQRSRGRAGPDHLRKLSQAWQPEPCDGGPAQTRHRHQGANIKNR